MIRNRIDNYEEQLILCSSSTKSLFSLFCLSSDSFNLLEFSLFPNMQNRFSLIKHILISDNNLISSLN